jgi:hypothetical protein
LGAPRGSKNFLKIIMDWERVPYQFEHENIFEAKLVIELAFAHHQTSDGVSGAKGANYAEIAGSQIAIVQVKGDQ